MAKKTAPVERPAPRPVGAPTSYRPEYCAQLLAHMRQGNSFESFAAVVGTHRATLYNWMGAHPEFLDARKQGLDLCTQFYENLGKMMATGQLRRVKSEEPILDKDGRPMLDPTTGQVLMRREYEPTQGNATAFIFLTKNIIGWRDKRDIQIGEIPGAKTPLPAMSDQEVEQRAAELAKKVTALVTK